MRVSDILYGLNVRKKAKKECCEDEKWAQAETIEIEGVNKNQNMKQAGDSTTTEENKMQKGIQIKKLWQKLRLN